MLVRSLIALLLAASLCAPAAARPSRVVSLNLCTDILLFELADREQIASLSFLAPDPNLSIIAGKLGNIPINYGRAEEVRLIDPDLVLAGDYGAQFAVSILKEHGFHVVQLPAVMRVTDIAPAIEKIGAAIGQGERAAAAAAHVRATLAELAASPPARHPSAVIFQERGFAAGRPGLADDILTLSGATNLAADAGFKEWVPLGVEGLLDLNPDVLVLDESGDKRPSLANAVLSHAALKVFASHGRLVRVPTRLWTCGVPETLGAVDLLRRAFAQRGGK